MAAKKKPTKKTSNNRQNRERKKSPDRTSSPLAREITFLFIIVFGILAFMSVFHMCGVFGEVLSSLLFGLLGAMAYVFPIYLIVASGFLISNPDNSELKRKFRFSLGFFLSLCGFFEWLVNHKVDNIWQIYSVCSKKQSGGGFLGGILSYVLTKLLGKGGALIVILALLVLFFMLISGKLIFSSIHRLYKEQAEDRKKYVDYTYDTYEEEPPQRQENVLPFRKRQMYTYKFEEETPTKNTTETVKPKKTVTEPVKPKETEQKEPDIRIFRSGDTDAANPVTESGEGASNDSEIYKQELENKFGAGKKEKTNSSEKPVSSKAETLPKETSLPDEPAKAQKPEKTKITENDEKEMAKVQDELSNAAVTEIPYQFPSLELLNRPKRGKKGMGNDELKATALKLQNTLESFGVKVKMGDISLGPSVTRYELIPEQGVKVSKITSLADDIKLSLAASDIRIEAPIPGKAAVGIEVPNPERMMITLRELLESREFTSAKSKVTFAVGKDISGKTIVTDIAKMPHLLIAGATGSGKSVLINTLIMSIIYKANPNDVKMIMVDPKMVELTAYEDIPHLMIPVVKDPKKASAALAWAVAEMTTRYQKFADAGVRDIASYNARIAKVTKNDSPEYQKMPQIVIIVDEFADLMMVAPGEVEDAVCRLAQLARAAGIHLVLATQRPSVNVITGLIKANIPSRIALSVSSAVDSRTIIDSGGAEKLLGNGDMLFAPQNLPKPIRVQGAFVSDEERDSVVSFLKNNSAGPSYNEDVTAHIESAPAPGEKGSAGGGAPEQDELFAEAGFFIIEKEKASIGLLQRMFRIGFNRAARIMDQLSTAGVVGPEEGTKARQILMSREQFENYLEENG
jgi:S-DNA-T family DNA segregation ATPase FtsK/SpoIIIE